MEAPAPTPTTPIEETHVIVPRDPRPSRRQAVLLYVSMLLMLLVLRGLTARPSADVPVRNMDEHLMFSVGVAPLTGGPPNTIGWPGGSMRIATTLLVPSVFAVEHRDTLLHHRRDAPVEFVHFLGRELRDPWRMVGLLRWVGIVLSSLGFAFLPLILRRFTTSNALAFAVSLAALCGGTFWVRSLMATGDAVGWATIVVGVWAALRARESVLHWTSWALLAALLAGMATGSKLTAIYLWPIVFLASIRSWQTLWRTVLIWLFVPLLGHYLINPYLVTDPIRVAKAVAGNLLTRPASTPWPQALLAGVPVGLLVAGLLSLPLALTRRRAWLALATLWTLAMYAVTVRGTRMIDPHYLTPLALPLAMLLACGLDFVARRRALAERPAVVGVVSVAIALLSVGFGAWATHAASRAAEERYGPGQATVRELARRNFNGRIAVEPSSHGWFLSALESDASIAESVARLERQVAGGESVVAVLGNAGFPEDAARGLADQFNDADRIMIANGRPASHSGKVGGLTVLPIAIGDPTLAKRSGVTLTRDAAVEMFRRGEVDGLLLASPVEGLTPTLDRSGGRDALPSVLYLRDAAPTTAPSTAPSTTRASE